MSTPEPLDEFPGGQPETRGGDQLADITVYGVKPDGTDLGNPVTEALLAAVRAHEAACDCDDGTPE